MDTLQCVWLAAQNPPQAGEYKVYNQFVETFTVNQLAKKIQTVGSALGLEVQIDHIENPRREAEEHYYNPVHTGLMELGLKPHYLTDTALAEMIEFVITYKERIDHNHHLPSIRWNK